VIVLVRKKLKHLKYGKFLNINFKYMIHDNKDTCKVGDNILIRQSRPYSKRKTWMFCKIVT